MAGGRWADLVDETHTETRDEETHCERYRDTETWDKKTLGESTGESRAEKPDEQKAKVSGSRMAPICGRKEQESAITHRSTNGGIVRHQAPMEKCGDWAAVEILFSGQQLGGEVKRVEERKEWRVSSGRQSDDGSCLTMAEEVEEQLGARPRMGFKEGKDHREIGEKEDLFNSYH